MTREELRTYAERGEMIPRAPVRASAEIMVDAPVETVWTVMTDVARWPSWYSYLKNAHLSGAFAAEARLRYGGFFKHDLIVGRADPCVMATVYGRLLIFNGITRWDFMEAGSRTSLRFTESSSGFLLGTLYSESALRRHLQDWLQALKSEAERRPAGAN